MAADEMILTSVLATLWFIALVGIIIVPDKN